jgi:antitoxin CptB
MSRRAKLAWHCRRGMRELDVLLERYMEHHYDQLDETGQALFERLLDFRNEDLMNWLLKDQVAPEPAIAALVQQIRQHPSE